MNPTGSRKDLCLFFLLAFLISWLFRIPLALDSNGHFPFPVPRSFYLVGLYGPAVSAIVIVSVRHGIEGLVQLLKPLLYLRAGLFWYLFAIFSRLAFCLAAFGISVLVGRDIVQGWEFDPLHWGFLLLYFTFGVLGEEIGFTSFVLPRVQENHNPLVASALLGLIWSIWHLPLFFTAHLPHVHHNFLLFAVTLTSYRILISWVYNNTGSSLFMANLTHGAFNAGTRAFPIPLYGVVSTAITALVTALIVSVVGANLGYVRSRPLDQDESS